MGGQLAVQSTGHARTSGARGIIVSLARLPQPIDLRPFGAPGCSLLVAGGAIVLGAPGSPAVAFSLGIPKASELLGATLHHQSFELRVGANARNPLTSGSLSLTIGRR